MVWTNDTPFQALSLTGGGYRGLFTARALQVMEEHVGVPIGQRFDLTCGASIGSECSSGCGGEGNRRSSGTRHRRRGVPYTVRA